MFQTKSASLYIELYTEMCIEVHMELYENSAQETIHERKCGATGKPISDQLALAERNW